MRVIVIGSGIAGLAAAIGLRKVGIEVTVYERAPELREVGAGISLWANAIRALAIDATEQSKSGHPGLPMGMADVATTLWSRFHKFDAADPR